MTNKERYAEWVAKQEYVPISMMPWWLDSVCAGKEWDVLFAEDENNNIVGAMPYLLCKRAWFKYIHMPALSQTAGIWVTAEVTADRWKTAEVCRQFKEQLDAMNLAYYYQQYLPGSLCVDAMRGLGFKTKAHATYCANDLSNIDGLIESFSKEKRRLLQKSSVLHAERSMEIEDFCRFYAHCQKTGKHITRLTREDLVVLERKARRLKQCEIISICNAEGVPYAAALLIWDKRCLYCLVPVSDTVYKESGAAAMLVLEAMKLAREKHVHFDFYHTDDRNAVKEFKQFGATPVSFYSVERAYKAIPAFIIRCVQRFT